MFTCPKSSACEPIIIHFSLLGCHGACATGEYRCTSDVRRWRTAGRQWRSLCRNRSKSTGCAAVAWTDPSHNRLTSTAGWRRRTAKCTRKLMIGQNHPQEEKWCESSCASVQFTRSPKNLNEKSCNISRIWLTALTFACVEPNWWMWKGLDGIVP